MERANAAQLAARSIKAARGTRRKTPIRSDAPAQQSMSFQSGGDGGLFGGSVQAPGTFSFAPSGGPSFPPSTFGNNNNPFGNNSSSDVSDGDDPRADTTGEEALRRKRTFQQNPDSALQKSNPFNQGGTFGQSQEKPAGSLFSFNSQPNTSGIFGQNQTQDKPLANPFSFGSTQSIPSSPGINFGPGPTQDKAANNVFGFSQPATQPAAPSLFNFAAPVSQDKPATPQFSFNSSSAQPPSSGINFGPTTATDKPASNIFGNSQSAPASTPNIFGSTANPTTTTTTTTTTTSNLFGSLKSTAPSSSNLFGTQEQNPSSPIDLFGGSGQQTQPSGTLFESSSHGPAKSLFEAPKPQSSAASNIFGKLSKPTDTASNLFSSLGQSSAQSTTIFGGMEKQKTPPGDTFGTLNKPLDESVTQPKVNGNLSNGSSSAADANVTTAGSSTPSLFGQSSSSNLFGTSKPLFSTPPVARAEPADNSSSNPPFSFGSTKTPAETHNKSTLSPMKPVDAPTKGYQPPSTGIFPNLAQSTQSPAKSAGELSALTAPQSSQVPAPPSTTNGITNGDTVQKSNTNSLYSGMDAASAITDEAMISLAPSWLNRRQQEEFFAAYRLRSLNKALAQFLTIIPPGLEITNAMEFYYQKRAEIVGRSSMSASGPKGKTPNDKDKLSQNSTKQNKPVEFSGSVQSQHERNQAPKSPIKSSLIDNQSQPYMNGSTTPKAPSFPPPQSFTPTAPPPVSPSPKGKRKAEKEFTKDDFEQGERESKRLNMNGASTGSNTLNIFKSIVDSPAKTSPEKKLKALPENSKEDTPRFNPFGNLPVPPSPAAITSPSATASSNIFATEPANSTTNIFSPKPATTNRTSSAASPPKSTVQPPKFGTGSGPVNFLAQFGQKALTDTAKDEAKRMEAAKDEDFDSDEEDEATWEARWKEKEKERQKEKSKEVDELAKTKRASFVPGQGFILGDKSDAAKPALSDAGTNNSVFSSLNGSRTPTPTNFGKASDNIFGHLTPDPDASGKDDDTDEEDGEADADSENKDPSYQPGNEASSGPGTPVEETGAGIASAKKSSFFSPLQKGLSDPSRNFSASPSAIGTPTPSGGLFGRINKDANGNAIRQLPSDEKENTQPSTTTNVFSSITNPFASSSFTKTSDPPADQTWKKDSPIKFGSATPTNENANPTVNVTAATPTKAPFSNLFGNSNTPKNGLPSTSVNFSFGAPSSNTSSLFPSAVVSATTSRATTPGGTTDGESAGEGDPDAEKHEQINLTAGGPGEENEEVLYEVRAKALIFKDGKWDTKGLGPLRVLKHNETMATRILLRADPSGTIVMNKALIPQKYEANAKTVKLITAGEGKGKGLETWLLQIKTAEAALGLVDVLEANKPPS